MGSTLDLKYLFQAHSNGVIPKCVCMLEAPGGVSKPNAHSHLTGCDLIGLDVPWQWNFL